ncbi:MAG: DUF6677 family protein [Planctomycetota bacterium]|jgi:hypothetical protein
MAQSSKNNYALFLLIVGLAGWLVPGGGHFLLREKKRAIIIFVTIVLTFCIGLYIGSIGVIDLVGTTAFYIKGAQMLNPPIVFALAHHTAAGGYPVYGRPNEIGQLYTGIAGLLNLLCIVNAVHLAHISKTQPTGG